MPRLVSGIQPTGNITLGNYLGAIKNFVKLQDELPEHEFFIFIADLHAITVFQDREKLRKNIKDLLCTQPHGRCCRRLRTVTVASIFQIYYIPGMC